MRRRLVCRPVVLMLVTLAWLLAACQPAPAPTAKPTDKPAEKAASPAASPAAKPAASPAASPAAAAPRDVGAATVDPSLASVWQGKTITIVVGFVAGGGNDTWARLFARHLGKYLPGNPTIIVENMPGAGGIIQANHVYSSKPDGLTIGIYERGMPTYQIQEAEGVRFDVTKLNWLASATTEQFFLVAHQRAGITQVNQLKEKELLIGGNEPGAIGQLWMLVMRDALGYKVRHVFGYAGQREVVLAIDRGDVDAVAIAWGSITVQKRDELQSKVYLPLAQIGGRAEDPLAAGVPNSEDLLSNASQEHKQMMAFIEQPLNWSRSFAVAPGTDPKVVGTMRAAFMQTMADAEFLADAEKLKLDVIPVPGERIQPLMAEYISTPKAVVEKLTRMLDADMPQ